MFSFQCWVFRAFGKRLNLRLCFQCCFFLLSESFSSSKQKDFNDRKFWRLSEKFLVSTNSEASTLINHTFIRLIIIIITPADKLINHTWKHWLWSLSSQQQKHSVVETFISLQTKTVFYEEPDDFLSFFCNDPVQWYNQRKEDQSEWRWWQRSRFLTENLLFVLSVYKRI